MINYKSYPFNYSERDTYKTDPSKKKAVFFNHSFTYYTRLLNVLIRSNRKVKKNIYDRYNWAASSFDVIHALESVGAKFDVRGLDNLKGLDRPAVIIGNHMSTAETMVLPGLIQPIMNVIFVIKQELVKYPLFGPIAAARHPIIVGRSNPREDLKLVMDEGAARLNDGRSIIIFPQKTRSKFFDRKAFNSMGIKLAKRNDAYVIPVALLTDCWGTGKVIKDIGKIDISKEIKIEFGKPFKVETNGTEEHNRVADFIESKLIEWNRKELVIS